MQMWVKRQICKYLTDPDQLEAMNICLVSARKMTGLSKILTILDKTKTKLNHLKHKPKVYFVGATNSGKSSVINSLLQTHKL